MSPSSQPYQLIFQTAQHGLYWIMAMVLVLGGIQILFAGILNDRNGKRHRDFPLQRTVRKVFGIGFIVAGLAVALYQYFRMIN